ncbi:MAG TPA: hypothetical protein VFI42_13390 [Thermomicrobiaceae bacterium]|nr:hypothetical protein [Thermomicrobiaceae bacterium]
MSGRSRSRPTPAPTAPSWDAITLLPSPLPGFALADVDPSTRFLGRACALPLLLEPSPGGGEPGALLDIARRARTPVNLGPLQSLDPAALPAASDEPLPPALAEVRLTQVAHEGVAALVERVRPLGLGALILRLDLASAAIAGAAPALEDGLELIAELSRELPLPLAVRDPAGLPRTTARALAERGVAALIAGGSEVFAGALPGGTNDERGGRFRHWGVPALAAIRMLRGVGPSVVSDGGAASGLDAAKAIALGADLVVYQCDSAAAPQAVEDFAATLRTAMYLAGAHRLSALRAVPFVATGETREWLEAAESLWRGDSSGRV